MLNVDAEVSKHKNVKDRGEYGKLIREYKGLAVQHADNLVMSGQYNMVALKLQELCDKLPSPNLKRAGASQNAAPTKTAKISKDEKAKISAAWEKKAGKK